MNEGKFGIVTPVSTSKQTMKTHYTSQHTNVVEENTLHLSAHQADDENTLYLSEHQSSRRKHTTSLSTPKQTMVTKSIPVSTPKQTMVIKTIPVSTPKQTMRT